MNKMDIEFIKHYEAKAAAAGTEFNWQDLIELVSIYDTELAIRTLDIKYEDELHKYFKGVFRDLVVDMKYQTVQWGIEHHMVNVVRCEYCKNWIKKEGICGASLLDMGPEDFCSRPDPYTLEDFGKED